MAAQIIDGKSIAARINEGLRQQVGQLEKKPKLDVILVGEDAASKIYVKKKQEACEKVGIVSQVHVFGETAEEKEVLDKIKELNDSSEVTGILLQLPVPKQLDEKNLVESISPAKDVDCLASANQGNLLHPNPLLAPCTPKGIVKLIESTGQDVGGKDAVIVNRSSLVGKPLSLLLLQKNCTVQICHSRTQNLAEKTHRADILISAVGKPGFISAEMVKEGAIVIDVGISRIEGKVLGDVSFESVAQKASFITPVPGGVGPMTVAMLLENTVIAAKNQ